MIPIFKKFLSGFPTFNYHSGELVYQTSGVKGELGNDKLTCIVRQKLDGKGHTMGLKIWHDIKNGPGDSNCSQVALNIDQARQLINDLEECISQLSRLDLNEKEDE